MGSLPLLHVGERPLAIDVHYLVNIFVRVGAYCIDVLVDRKDNCYFIWIYLWFV